MKAIILAAGKGSRLGERDIPKPLTMLNNKTSILGLLLDNLKQFIPLDDVIVIVGYHKEMIMDLFPDVSFVFNPDFAKENTAKSLLRALKKLNEDVLWVNGDVIVHKSVLEKIVTFNKTSMIVNRSNVGEEEVKYRSDEQGKILEVSKEVHNPQGEALGVNLIKKSDLDLFKSQLENCQLRDYFEKGLEMCIQKGMEIWSIPINADLCAEIDFPEDLDRANHLLQTWNKV
jgi:L-glutamine-phosphate cytidylyltransferase